MDKVELPIIALPIEVFAFENFFLRQTHSYVLVEWENVDYNLGHFFDGTWFTVPENGLYSFYAYCRLYFGEIRLYLNDYSRIHESRAESNSSYGFVHIDTTLKLVKNDKVHVRFSGDFASTNVASTTYFEGRMIARLEE